MDQHTERRQARSRVRALAWMAVLAFAGCSGDKSNGPTKAGGSSSDPGRIVVDVSEMPDVEGRLDEP